MGDLPVTLFTSTRWRKLGVDTSDLMVSKRPPRHVLRPVLINIFLPSETSVLIDIDIALLHSFSLSSLQSRLKVSNAMAFTTFHFGIYWGEHL